MLIKNKKSIYIIGLVLVFLIFFIILPRLFPGTFSDIGAGFWKAGEKSEDLVSSVFTAFSSKNNLVEEREDLEDEIDRLERKILFQNILESRVTELEHLLNIRKEGFIVARVLSKPPHSPYDTFIIERGLRDGVKRGDRVYMEDNFILGEIIETSSKTSKAKLLSNPGDIIQVELPDGTFTEAKGRGSGNFLIELPREISIKKGDAITIPGSEIFIVGFVEEIESKPKDPFKNVYFSIPFNINTIKWVEVQKSQ